MAATVQDAGEFGLIARMTEGLARTPHVRVGVGDDCAVLAPHGQVAVSTDAMIEDVHFKRSWSSAHDVGRKAVASAMADVEAMAARPMAVVAAMSVPADTPISWVEECSGGIRDEVDLCGAALVGGDVTRGNHISIVVTVLGDMEGRDPVLRSGARVGDEVAYVGRLGMAAAGLAVLSRGFRSPGVVVRAHRVPEVPYGQGMVAWQAGATAMIDCSDGLVADLAHIAEESGVTIALDTSTLEASEPQKTVAAAIGGGDPLAYILGGGEDHALLATFPVGHTPAGWTIIGQVTESCDEGPVLVDGHVWDGDAGWRHF